MKKIIMSSYYTLLTILFLLIITLVLTGCGNNSGDGYEPPEFVYLPEVIPLPMPEGVSWIDNVTISGDSVYFTAMAEGDANNTFTSYDIYTMDLDGSNSRALPEYSIGTEIPEEATDGNIQIYSICIDSSGYIWIAERGEFFYFPDGLDEDDWERWNKRIMVKDFTRVRKLADTGAEVLSFDVSHITAGQDWFYISAFIVDDNNNIYIGDDSQVYVFDNEGKAVFTLDAQWVERFIKMQDGSIANSGWGNRGKELTKIDVVGKKWGETINLPSNAHNIYRGNEEYTILFTDGNGLYGIEEASGEVTMLLNWIDSDITTDGLGSITFLPDERILITSQTWNNDRQVQEIIFLSKTPYSELPERSVLTLATFYLDFNIRSTVVQFNRTSTTHRIRVTDYSEFNTDDDVQAGLTRLSTEIVSGNVPDILDVSNLPFTQYAAKGLLLDLYPLIDSDPVFDRSDFMESAFRATEINGGLYKIFPYF